MTFHATRRRFLNLLGAAPVALPVAAKEAAAKMGLESVTAASQPLMSSLPGESTASDLDWQEKYFKSELRELFSSENVRQRKRMARAHSHVLDADLAALRSMSPAVAYIKQQERNIERAIKDTREEMQDRISAIARKRMLGS